MSMTYLIIGIVTGAAGIVMLLLAMTSSPAIKAKDKHGRGKGGDDANTRHGGNGPDGHF